MDADSHHPPTEITLDAAKPPEFDVEIPTMKSLYIEMRYGDTLLGSGTAILAANDQSGHCALITNRHNLTGRHQQSGACLSKTGGVPDNISIHFHKKANQIGEWQKVTLPLYRSDGTQWWIEHPRLGASADIVALNLSWGDDVLKLPYYMKTSLDRGDMAVAPAEPVSVIGFPFGLFSVGKFPIWATGFLAQELSLVTPDNPTFLIDCRTRPGQSGSPVIAYRPSGYRQHKDGRISASLSAEKVWEFLGLYSGRVNNDSDLGVVWHVSAIEELLIAASRATPVKGNSNDAAVPNTAAD